ncbi:amidohydrolase family protein [Variovorax ginsengisoli]|uniref:Amidohydrolase family protein n=1 Tax=Variovorax ginsengisoli TaxID=363844 RepID=A0ABT8SKG2_9BURK|nr:amidohydrolase family protein [Variovorax ginsengisoli]MDN8618901.1 amidohydrolase family protein [Variovorax ginsengisoli]MDO1538071.1 amidohydrolase family protein [Variovorax ginsengisoli]
MSDHTPRTLLIQGALVLTMDPALGDLESGDVLVEGRRIAQVGTALEAPAGAQRIDGRGMILIPGLIDSHTHMWQAPLKGLGAGLWGTPDYQKHVFPLREKFDAVDMHDACFAAGTEMLDNGITTVLDFCHNTMTPAHAEQSIAAHRRTGQRVLFSYGMLGGFSTLAADHPWRLAQVREMAHEIGSGGGDSLVRLGMALGSLEYSGLELVKTEIELGRALGLPMTFHQNPPAQIRQLGEAGLLGGDLLPVHANLAADDELDMLAACGAGISFTVEGEFGGGRAMNIIGRAHRAGVTPSLGVDIPSRVALDLFAQMRLTFQVMRAEEALAERITGRWPLARHPGTPHAQPRHMLEYVTVNAARAVGRGDELGRIAPGLLADLVLLSTGPYSMSLGDPAAHVAFQSTPADVDTVIVDGQVRKRDGRLVDLDRADAAEATRRVRERVLGKGVQAARAAA